ncbi:MAG: ABC transporter permease [Bacteroidota bacterium]
MKSNSTPPKYAQKLLQMLLKEELVEEILGDLEEKFQEMLEQQSPFRAKLNYWYQTTNYLRPFALKNILITEFNPFLMWRHNLLLSLRNFQKDSTTFLINLTGMTIALTCVLLIYLWVADELSVDKFHAKDTQLYQVMKHSTSPQGEIYSFPWTPPPLAKALREEMPEVEYSTSLRLRNDDQKGILKYEEKQLKFTEQYAESDFFQMFTYDILEGDRSRFLQQKDEVVISDQLAQKVFGKTTDLVGQTFEWEKEPFSGIYKVAGVYKMPPANASMQFDLVFHFDLVNDHFPDNNKWTYGGPDTYIALKAGTNPATFQEKISTYLQEKSNEDYQTLFIRPYSDKYLYNKYENGKIVGGRIDYVWLFSIIAIFVLAIACINFMNLATAKAAKRSKEVGVKKAIGASKGHLIQQYLSESVLLTFFSLFLALGIVFLFLPQFNFITDKTLTFSFSSKMFASILGIVFLTGLLSGSYPAFYLSRFEAVEVLKGKIRRSFGEIWLRKGLVVFQFTVSIILIISVLVVYHQIQFIQNKNLGFHKDQIIHFTKDGQLNENLNTFLTEVKNIPTVVNTAGMGSDLLENGSRTTGVRWEGYTEDNAIAFKYIRVGYDLLETIGVELAEGRNFQKAFGNEENKIIFNEAAIQAMGLEDPIGKTVRQWGADKQIVGVVKDFHFESLYEPIYPCFIFLEENPSEIMVKIEAGTEKTTLAQLDAVYKRFNDGLSLDYRFLDADYAQFYASEERIAKLSKHFASIAILISCLGLLGLVTFSAQRRKREIGIRKVLGASTFSIVQMLSADFTKMVVVAIIIALPISYYIASDWLKGFAFKIELQVWYFIIASLVALLLTWLTVSFQTLTTAKLNPIDTLKEE